MHVPNNIKTIHTATYKEWDKHVIYRLYNIKVQKEVKSNPKQPSCKKSVQPPRMLLWKKIWNPKVAAKKWLWW